MSIFDEIKGFMFVYNYELPVEYSGIAKTCSLINPEGEIRCWFIDNRLHRFSKDEVLVNNGDQIAFLDGFIENKSEITAKSSYRKWDEMVFDILRTGTYDSFRGGFCGFYCDANNCTLFVDHVGNRSLYYYSDGNSFVISTRLYYISDFLKKAGVDRRVDEQAIKYLVTLGFMPDNSTICKDIKRVLPGETVSINGDGRVNAGFYFRPNNTNIINNMTFSDAIEGLDHYFRQAIKREFEKDKEYDFRHLVDLSGGLDSRMVSWVAHDMGYTDQINTTYCRKNYLDFYIAQQIACDLRHKFIFMPLDDFKWIEDVEINTMMLNATVPYAGATGAHHFLELIKECDCGIEHTGMVGDAIIGTFFKDEYTNYSKASGKENAYSSFLPYVVPKEIVDKFENKEVFSIFTRGLLGAQSSYMMRQNYYETGSTFLDCDFLEFILSVPFKYRVNHRLYFEWIKEKYPRASEYGWEKWHGAKPRENNRRFIKKIYQLKYSANSMASSILNRRIPIGMTPLDYWFKRYPDTAERLNAYFRECCEMIKSSIAPELLSDLIRMYDNGSYGEKEQVITACASIKIL